MKWKTTEATNDYKFRLLISHALHPLRRLSKAVGRCLTQLLKELHTAFPCWGTPTMQCVRDVWTHVHHAPPQLVRLWERDVDNAYWELNKEQVLKSGAQSSGSGA